MKKKLFAVVFIVLFFKINLSAQSWNYEKLKNLYSKTKSSVLEGFYEIDSDRKYLIGVIKVGNQYQIYYLYGNSEKWVEGDIKGYIEKVNEVYTAKWDESVKPGNVPLFSLPLILELNGFYLKWPTDSPDHFRKINLAECDIVRRKYITEKSVKMVTSKSGIFEIPATINNVLKIFLILDTGASDVSISPDVVLTLIKAKAIKDNDWLEGRYYRFADGSIAKSQRFIIRYLKIGEFEIKDVEASISNSIEAPLLLGQSALSKLGKIQIDYKTQEFKIIN